MKITVVIFLICLFLNCQLVLGVEISPRFVYCAYGGYFKGIKTFYEEPDIPFSRSDTRNSFGEDVLKNELKRELTLRRENQTSNSNNEVDLDVVGIQFICSRGDIIIEGLGKKDGDFVFGEETNNFQSRVCDEPEDAVNWIINHDGDLFPVCYPYQKNRKDFVQDKKMLYVSPKNFSSELESDQLWKHWFDDDGSGSQFCDVTFYSQKDEIIYSRLNIVNVAFRYNDQNQSNFESSFENKLISVLPYWCKTVYLRDEEIMEGCGGPLNEKNNSKIYENDPHGVDNNNRHFECVESHGWRDAQCQGFDNDYCKWIRNLDSNETWYTCNLATFKSCTNVSDCKDRYPPKYTYNQQQVSNFKQQCENFDEFQYTYWYQILSKNDPKKCLTIVLEEDAFFAEFQNCSDLRFDILQRFRVNFELKDKINVVEIESGKLPGWCLEKNNSNNAQFSLKFCNQDSLIFNPNYASKFIKDLEFKQFELRKLAYETWANEMDAMHDFFSGFNESIQELDQVKRERFWNLNLFEKDFSFLSTVWNLVHSNEQNSQLLNVFVFSKRNYCNDRQIWCNRVDERIVAIDADFFGELDLRGNLQKNIFRVFNLPKLVALNLKNSNLEGSLPYLKNLLQEPLKKISQLKLLDLTNNKISGFLPFDWGRNKFFRNLEVLNLNENSELMGIFPKTWNFQTFSRNFSGSILDTKICYDSKNPKNWKISKKCDVFKHNGKLKQYKFSTTIIGQQNECVNCAYFENSKFNNISESIYYLLGDVMKFTANNNYILNCQSLNNGPCKNQREIPKRKLLKENQYQSQVQFEIQMNGIENQENEAKIRLENHLPKIYDEIASVKIEEFQDESNNLSVGEILAIALSAFIVVFVLVFLFFYFFLIPKIIKPYRNKINAKKALNDIPEIIEKIDQEFKADDVQVLIDQIDKRWGGKSSDQTFSSGISIYTYDENSPLNSKSSKFDSKRNLFGEETSSVLVSLDESKSSGRISLNILPRQTFFSVQENVTLSSFEQTNQQRIDYEDLKDLFQVPKNIVPNSENQLIITQSTPFFHDIDLEIDVERDIQLMHIIGSGAFGTVYKGTWTSYKTGKTAEVAVKFLKNGGLQELSGQSMLKNFKEELALMGRINHPNIVKCYGGCLKPDNLAIVMEFMHGGNLHDYIHEIHRNQQISEIEILRIVAHIAAGLNYLHPSILHRDLKPQNVLLDAYGVPKISDFGVSKLRKNTVTMTNNKVIGTPQYIAPEVWVGQSMSNEKSDIYSLGIIAWEMLTGERPWMQCSTYVQILALVIIFKKRPVIPQSCSPQLTELIEDCWDNDPKRRPGAGTIHRQILWHLQRQGN